MKIHKRSLKTMYKLFFVIWIAIGSSVLIRGDISRVSYGCLLVSALLYIIDIIKILKKDDEDADNR